MPSALTASGSYKSLIGSIETSYKAGLAAAQKALEYQRLKTYWQIGRQITGFIAASNGAVRTTEKFYRGLSADLTKRAGLDLSADTIGRMVQFYGHYPRFPDRTTLTFTHYLALMRVSDPKQRRQLEQKAMARGWSNLDIRLAITQLSAPLITAPKTTKKLALTRGEPYVYAVHQYTDLTGRKELYIDAGFKLDVPLNGMIVHAAVSAAAQDARGVRVVKKDGRYAVHQYKEAGDKLYTYAAAVTKVVDADTVDVQIDVGFGIRLHDRLRLRGINASEIATQEGKAAKAFVVRYLKKCPLIVLRTYKQKEEMYGRWLADIFALAGCADPCRIAAEGEFLNQRLLDEHLAEVYNS